MGLHVTGEVVTRANGNVEDRVGRPADNGQLGIIDHQCRLIGLHLYDGLFKARVRRIGGLASTPLGSMRLFHAVEDDMLPTLIRQSEVSRRLGSTTAETSPQPQPPLPLSVHIGTATEPAWRWTQVIPVDDAGQLHEAFNIRLEELTVIDIKFLYGTRQPVVAVLYQDTKEARHFKTYIVLLKDKVLRAACRCSDRTNDPSLIADQPSPNICDALCSLQKNASILCRGNLLAVSHTLLPAGFLASIS